MIEINGKTKQLAVIGNPVEHSFSPQIHNFISEELGKNYVYGTFCVESENLAAAVRGIRALGIAGVNVTVPHKQAIMPYLDEISESAGYYNSVNTVVNRGGKLIGYSTDAEGFYMSLVREGFDFHGKDILVLGAGGVVQPLVMMFVKEGAASVTIINRTAEKAERIAATVREKTGADVECKITRARYDLVVNMTSVGLYPNVDKMPSADLDLLDENSFAADLIYNPEETLFLKRAKERGAKTVNGLGMLIFQAIRAYELFIDEKIGNEMYDKILKEVFKR